MQRNNRKKSYPVPTSPVSTKKAATQLSAPASSSTSSSAPLLPCHSFPSPSSVFGFSDTIPPNTELPTPASQQDSCYFESLPKVGGEETTTGDEQPKSDSSLLLMKLEDKGGADGAISSSQELGVELEQRNPPEEDEGGIEKSVEANALFASLADFDFFSLMPQELQLQLLTYCLSARDLVALGSTCRLLHILADGNLVWRVQAKRLWKLRHTRQHKRLIWRAYYKQRVGFYKKDAMEWKKLERPSSPAERCAHSGCVVGKKIYYIGGQDNRDHRLGEVHCYDTERNTWEQVAVQGPVPNFARHQAMAIGDKIYCFGGFDLKQFYDLAIFDPSAGTWTYPKTWGDVPQARSNHGSAVIGRKLYIFGGSIGDNLNKYETINDFYCIDVDTLEWKNLRAKNAPIPRVGHKMVAIEDKIYLFGGGVWSSELGWTEQYSDTFVYNSVSNEWTEIRPDIKPPVSTYPYIFAVGTNVFIFGGASVEGNHVEKDLWIFDTITARWRKPTILGDLPTARSMGTSDVVGNDVYFWGGYCGGVIPAAQDFYKLIINVDMSEHLWHREHATSEPISASDDHSEYLLNDGPLASESVAFSMGGGGGNHGNGPFPSPCTRNVMDRSSSIPSSMSSQPGVTSSSNNLLNSASSC